jgi:glycerol-3-phosphate dehydrogenase subunit C
MHTEGTGAPTRHVIPWDEASYADPAALDAELRRQFDVCHGCRRCFNLCDSFPRLFYLIDASKSGELDTVASADFKPVVDACTLCDMCFMTKCPYVPPHTFNIDFPHLMLRYRAREQGQGKVGFAQREIRKTDRNGAEATRLAALANWGTSVANKLGRLALAALAGIHPRAWLPTYVRAQDVLVVRAAREPGALGSPKKQRKVVLYATCAGNFHKPEIGLATRAVLARNGIESVVVHPGCCGMPQLEIGDLVAVAASARTVAAALVAWLDKGYDVVALTPSCALMLKFEWPLIAPKDANVQRLAKATRDVAEYIVEVAKQDGLAEGLAPMPEPVALHIACHARAQNMGAKAADLLRLIPDANVTVVERCSGHGGAWGAEKPNFEVALKVGKPVFRRVLELQPAHVASECPLAGDHIVQGVKELEPGADVKPAVHPIVLFARAYGINVGASA